MESSSLASIKEQIEKERSGLRAKANRLEAELATVEVQLDSLTKAIAALDGHEATPAKKPVAKKRVDKPAAGKSQVATLLHELLSDRGVLEETRLREEAEAKLTEAGFSRMGFALRFKEALQDPRFIDTPGGIRLKEQQEAMLQT